ncbi:MAG: SRPBCC family protein [Micromonosporaceae bacterium]
MGDLKLTPTAQGTIEIEAPPELVYGLVSNVPAMPEWAAETERCVWIGGADRAEEGARFRGRNAHRRRKWATTCTVTAAEAGERFSFKVAVGGFHTATWWYDIEPTDTGCRVTEGTQRRVPWLLALVVNRGLLGIPDRDAHNQRNIERTLEQLKAHAEALATPSPEANG